MPNVGGLVISNLNATSTMPLRHSNIMHSRHWLDSRFLLLHAIRTENPEMNLSIDRGGIFENRWPVNIPICEDRPRVARWRQDAVDLESAPVPKRVTPHLPREGRPVFWKC